MAIKKIKVSGTSYDVNDSRIAGIDNTPTASSTNLVTSGGVKSYIDFVTVSSVDESEYEPAAQHEYVDLGLRDGSGNRIMFATTNIGASNPEEFGDYYAWAEVTKRYNSINGDNEFVGDDSVSFDYQNAPYFSNWSWTKYNSTDNKATLESTDDIATISWGGSWRMPTKSELEYLLNGAYCTISWTSNYNSTGVAGIVVTGKGDYLANSIFIPAGGYGYYGSVSSNDCAYCWSSTIYEDNEECAYYLISSEYDTSVYGGDGFIRGYGLPIRPVQVLPPLS